MGWSETAAEGLSERSKVAGQLTVVSAYPHEWHTWCFIHNREHGRMPANPPPDNASWSNVRATGRVR